MSEDFIRFLAELINGDYEEMYSYKSGPKLVSFFNQYFNYNDVYQQGFPSRWLYTYNKIVEIMNSKEIDKFFNIILDKRFIMRDLKISNENAVERENLIYNKINEKALIEGYYLVKKNGKYKFMEKDKDLEYVGGGGFAEIYLQKSTNVIVKKLREEFYNDKGIKSRFKREFLITKSLNDMDGIIKVHEFNEDDYTYSMERAEQTLEDYIKNNELNQSQKLTCIHQILSIMEKVHKRGIIHRDISPNNILVLNGLLKISDFGLGKDLTMLTSHQTIRTNAVGQYYYCAPEQFMLLKDGDSRSDVYSLGRVINFIMNKDPRMTNHILRNVAEKATSENPAFRYLDASELYKAVKKGIAFSEDENRAISIRKKIIKKEFDEYVEEYIFEQSAEELLTNISAIPNFKFAVMKFISVDSKHVSFFIETITDNYQGFYKRFQEYDNLAEITYNIIIGEYAFPIKELAANILNYIAKHINRFYAQDLVKKAISSGIDPFIEEILM